MSWQRRGSRPVDCYLIYGREEPDGDEPLVEVVATEGEAYELEATVGRQIPNLKIQWETVPWYREEGAVASRNTADRFIHLAFLGMEDNPIGLAAFDDISNADSMVADYNSRGEGAHRRTVALGKWLSDRHSLSTD